MAPFSWAFVLLAFGGGGLPGRPSSLSDHRSGVGFLRSSFGVGFARADAETEEGDEYPDLTGGRKCSNHKATRCLKEYEDCLLFSGPAQWQPKLCECQEQYYGVCLRGAGCAADKMLECIEMQIESACDDMSICGSNCGRHENNFVRDSQVVLPVNNFGKNFLRFSVCERSYNARSLSRHSAVRMERCDESTFRECPFWIPPGTYTALAISSNTSYIKMEYCNLNEADDHWGCLTEPRPKEYYGTRIHWPSTIDVDFTDATFCKGDADCPGSSCDTVQQPPTCSPRVRRQFEEAASSFFSEPFEDRETVHTREYANSAVHGQQGEL